MIRREGRGRGGGGGGGGRKRRAWLIGSDWKKCKKVKMGKPDSHSRDSSSSSAFPSYISEVHHFGV